MYRRLYRQEGGGLGGLNPHDYMRQEVDKYVQDYNRRNQGEVAAKVMPRPNFIQRNIEPYKNKLYDKLANLAGDEERVQTMSDLRIEGSNLKNPVYFPSELETGLMSDLRHKSASNTLSQNLSPNIPGGEIIGDSLSFLGGGLRELKNMLPPILTGRTEQENLENWRATQEDLKANKEGTFNTPNTTTTEDIYREGLNLPKPEQTTNNPYIGASHNSPMWFGGYPLQSGDTLTAEKMRMNRQGHTRDYRIPPNLKLQYNDDGTGTIVSRPADEMQESTPGYTTENWWKALRHYNPNYEEDRSNYFNREDSNRFIQQQEQPINTGGFGVDFTNSNRDLINATDFNLLQNYYQGQQ